MPKNNRDLELLDEDVLVEISDAEGNDVRYFAEELIIPVNGENFAILVEVSDDEHEHHCHDENCDCCDDGEVIIAKIVLNEDGEEEYVEPTDEEFDAVQRAYEQLMYEAEDDEE